MTIAAPATTSSGPKQNLAGAVAPTVNDDASGGYSVGSTWIDVVAQERYVCLDASAGAAIWEKSTTGTASEIVNTPAGGIAATTVQSAINELETEKAPSAHTHAAGDITGTKTSAFISDFTSAVSALVSSVGAGLFSVLGHTHTKSQVTDFPADASQVEAEAGTESGARTFSPLRIAQAISALGGGGGGDTFAVHDAVLSAHKGSYKYSTSMLEADAGEALGSNMTLAHYLNGFRINSTGPGYFGYSVLGIDGDFTTSEGRDICVSVAEKFADFSSGGSGFGLTEDEGFSWSSGTTSTARVGFEYRGASDFRAVTSDATSKTTSTDLSALIQAGRMNIFTIYYDVSANLAYFYINGTLVATLTTSNLTSGGRQLKWGWSFANSNVDHFVQAVLTSVETYNV